MLLTEIPNLIKCKKIYNLKNISFNKIYTNSNYVSKSSIFIIEKKEKLKKKYIKEAITKGAIAIISNEFIPNLLITQFVVVNINLSLLNILKTIRPNKPLNTIAITGTNGKTSVVWYISQILNYNDILVKSYGTLGYYINLKKKYSSKLTTPDFTILHQTAYSSKKNLYNYVFEASSHALSQNRIKDLKVDTAALTNISRDHLDYHKDFKTYKKEKLKLFFNHLNESGWAVLNDKIKDIEIIKNKLRKKVNIITYGMPNSDVNIIKRKKYAVITIFKKKYSINTNLNSFIELENLECAIACSLSIDVKIKKILTILRKIINPPGRLQRVLNDNKNFKIYIDYAHTPEALKEVLISKTYYNKKPNVVFGCGGDRDKGKREKMGRIANLYANRIYITDDNPRFEDSSKIRQSILKYCKNHAIEIPERKKAIINAIDDLKKNEILIIAGKGHEKFQIIRDISYPLDDYKVATKALRKKL
ncbi:UDP-N-acetylmuramoyl-L-alanyl-D-glutamate--2,6-diaminopimelate ligase [Alphaproteobacteria bacterium]|nr:UDP-N-acetylmuramoyl-L-alanyl-D-glutamate--2,6-diaminopimelate ligase [Alphaproteobacteria bacterium]